MALLIFITVSCILIFGVELVARRLRLDVGITRRITHIGAAIIACIAPLYLNYLIVIFACIGFSCLMLFLKNKYALHINSVKRKTLGEVYLPLGEALSALLFLPQNVQSFQYGVIVMGISDAAAGLIGEKFGKHPFTILGAKKSVEGTVTFFITCLVITYFFSQSVGLHLIVLPVILTVVEMISDNGTDNLVLPIVGSVLYSFLVYFVL